MSTDPRPPRPTPSVEEINAYLERSAARTKLRLPLAKGAAAVVLPANAPASMPSAERPLAEQAATRKLPVQGKTRSALPGGAGAVAPPAAGANAPDEARGDDEGSWRPFPGGGER